MRTIHLIILAGLVHLCLFFSPVQAKSYRIERVDILARVNPDGSMRIEESRTYRFKGQFKWADYRLPIKGFSSLEDFRLGEDGRDYQPGQAEQPGTYQIKKRSDEFYVKWFYRASNETRTFVLSYTVRDLLRVYPDVAEVYYQFIGEGWDHQTGQVQVTVILPGGAAKEEIHAWAHGPLWGNVSIIDGQTVQLDVSNLPKHQFWEGRILFPSRLVPDLAMTGSAPRLNRIIEEETQWAEEANERRIRAQQELEERNQRWWRWSIVFAVLSAGGLLFWMQLFRRYGRAYPAGVQARYYSDLPSGLPPALIGYLVNHRSISSAALVATIFDLARRGVLTIEEKRTRKKSFFGEREKTDYLLKLERNLPEETAGTILPFEQELLDFLFNTLGAGEDHLAMKEIARSRSQTQKWFAQWKKSISALAKEKGLYDAESKRKMRRGLIPSIGLILLGAAAIFLAGPGAVIPLATGLVLLIMTLTTNRVARPYVDQYAQWKGLRRYLKENKFLEDRSAGAASKLSRYLIYGIVLGVSSKSIKNLIGLIPEDQHSTLFPWYIYYGSFSGDHFGAAFGEAVSTMVSVAGSSLSSATGAGGGASAGGGGGAGGSGGGAG